MFEIKGLHVFYELGNEYSNVISSLQEVDA
jgi:hypothetical protein